ncbi:hypothetical protein [Mycobacterium marinum]|uniref:hypothetical protein n=1 Tax=Mycobacterium marinum TaxID=1781 RepID=UPI0021C40FDF|nr:hypothetical protein [Mycobacterium marinum]
MRRLSDPVAAPTRWAGSVAELGEQTEAVQAQGRVGHGRTRQRTERDILPAI